MIGFEAEPAKEKGHPDEDLETQNLDKRELYNLVAKNYYLPAIHSRGITREYLYAVYKDRLFRVSTNTLKHFEVDLTPAQTRRIGIPNNCLLVRKINLLLQSRKQPDLWPDAFDPPEEVGYSHQTWLYRMARYIDPTNLLEFFESPIRDEPLVNSHSHNFAKVHWGRQRASKYFFRLDQAVKDRKLWKAFKTISANYRVYLCLQVTEEKVRLDLEDAIRRKEELGRVIQDQVSKTAFTYTSIEDPQITPDMIIQGHENLNKEVRDKIHLNCKL
jgi:hypothetical protein